MKLRAVLVRVLVGVALVAAFGIGFGIVRMLQSGSMGAHAEHATYYCPMHPTYTSEKSGDCPICQMRLVKKEEVTKSPSDQVTEKSTKDICYLHNCPMAHEGKPCPMLVVAKPGEKITCPICGAHVAEAAVQKSGKKILYWTDPMIPGYKADKPGKSPMGMDLIPVYEEAGAIQAASGTEGYAPIMVSPQKQQLIGVTSAPAARRPMTKTIRTVGKVMVDETKIVHVHPKVEGWLRELYAKYEGDAVKKGQPLFSFYSPDFVATQQEYLAARKALLEIPPRASEEIRMIARNNAAAARQRLLWWDVTEEQIRTLEQQGAPQEALVFVSPIDGIVLTKHVFAGEFMERGGDFYHIVDPSSVWVNVEVYEADLPLVALGQRAVITLPNEPGRRLEGAVTFISPTVKAETRTAIARLEVPNPDGTLRPGSYANAELSAALGERLVVPAEAILDTGARKILFVDKGEGIFEPRDVVTGPSADGYVEVLKGVAEGERVVTSGNFLIDSESRLNAALQGMSGSPEHQHGQ